MLHPSQTTPCIVVRNRNVSCANQAVAHAAIVIFFHLGIACGSTCDCFPRPMPRASMAPYPYLISGYSSPA